MTHPEDAWLESGRRTRASLRQAVAGVLFLRNKLEAEQTERRVRLARTCHALLRAVRAGDDALALPLVDHRRALRRRVVAAEDELATLRRRAADAARELALLSHAIRRAERRRARRAARARRARAA